MEKINFPSEREQEFRPFKAVFFPDEFNSETPIFDDYSEPSYNDLVPPEEPEDLF